MFHYINARLPNMQYRQRLHDRQHPNQALSQDDVTQHLAQCLLRYNVHAGTLAHLRSNNQLILTHAKATLVDLLLITLSAANKLDISLNKEVDIGTVYHGTPNVSDYTQTLQIDVMVRTITLAQADLAAALISTAPDRKGVQTAAIITIATAILRILANFGQDPGALVADALATPSA